VPLSMPPEDGAPSAWLLTQRDLDRLPVIVTDMAGDPHVSCRAVQAGEREAAEEQADALRGEIARLSALLRERVPVADLAQARRERDEARAEVVRLGQEFYRAPENRQAGLLDRERRTQRPALVHEGEGIAIPETFLPTPEHPVALRVTGPGLVEYDGHELRITYDNPDGARAPGGLGTDPRRPRLDWYPDDGVTLSYRELRQLIGLHLQRCTDDPDLAAAMRDGESPLHLPEVLDR
jgi:hypothetical protein